MASRGTIGFIHKGKMKLTWVAYGGDPCNLGCEAMSFVAERDDMTLAEIAGGIVFVPDETQVPDEDKEKLVEMAQALLDDKAKKKPSPINDIKMRLAKAEITLTPALTHETFMSIVDSCFGIYGYGYNVMVEASEYPTTKWCEGVAIINLDERRIELYCGDLHREDGLPAAIDGPDRWPWKQFLIAMVPFDEARNVTDVDAWWQAFAQKTWVE